ncbi:MAG: ABC transporter ATP-binding protein [Sphaerochaetaceae bacterium]|nr:ABC transporter ATP-binding protein/permease [Sphaerochaetaceae bacterium]MDD4258542.1 ABC transporter ATP-binding protein [Sphaerochaetaceae bacterium]MDD4840479.1 ABC transporter ATP-binding protein [Sphaerochaetaceae bacterium]NLO61412.1 ABC transporter ATP-binding protein [Spirochaetales bacterium]
MRLLLNYLSHSKMFVLLIILLLMGKAIADLALPSYTSNIVNVGIQQQGIEHAIFEQLGETTYQKIIFMLDEQQGLRFSDAYNRSGSIYYLNDFSDRAEIERITVNAFAMLTTMDEDLATQAVIASIAKEYASLGVDVDTMRLRYILISGLKMLALAFTSIVLSILVSFIAARVAAKLGKELRADQFAKILSFSRPEMDTFSTASLITRSTNDVQQIQMSSVMLLRIVFFAPIMAIGGILRVLSVQTTLAWTIGVGVAAIFTIVGILFAFVMPKFKKLQTLIDKTNLVMRERLSGLQVIRAFGTYRHEQRRFDKANKEVTETSLFVNRAMSAMMPLMMLVMNIITVLILYNGAHQIDAGMMQVGDMMAFMQYGMQILMSFLMITMLSIMLPRASVSATRIQEVLETPLSITDPETTFVPDGSQEGVVEFKHVGFSYPEADSKALDDISFKATPGTTLAIIGSTGSGKSTLLNLLVRFYDTTEGTVMVEGQDIKTLSPRHIRSRIGYVPQKAILFSGTVASNIAFGIEEDPELIQRAATIAQASEFIGQMPNTYQASISQGGTNVSGGQRQRVAIARAIAAKRPILIFDDSFSALDYRTDTALRKTLKRALSQTTVIIVAQRISTIVHADRILVLEDGKIVGDGKHKELLASCAVYRQIASSQLSEKEMDL